MKRYQAIFLHPLFIFTRLLLVSVNAHADASLLQQFRVDTHIELAQFFERNIIKFEFVKQNWELEFDGANYKFRTISDQLQLATSISESDPVDSFALTLVGNSSQCYDSSGKETKTKGFSNIWVDGKQMLIGDTFIHEDLDELDVQGKYRSLDVELSFEQLTYVDDTCSGSVQMSVELEI